MPAPTFATSLAAHAPHAVVGLHLQMEASRSRRRRRRRTGRRCHRRRTRTFDTLAHYETVDGAYTFLNGTKPYTVGFGLTDSPVGRATWILEKLHSWTTAVGDRHDTPFGAVSIDDALAIVTTYWVTGTAASAARFYADAGAAMARTRTRTTVPTGCAAFPGDIVVPSRRWAEHDYPNLVHWTDMAAHGGDFGALEAPDLLAADLRARSSARSASRHARRVRSPGRARPLARRSVRSLVAQNSTSSASRSNGRTAGRR